MKLIIVHYHLRPGGIRRVIELAAPHLCRRLGEVESVILASGEAGDRWWQENFARQLRPVTVEPFIAPVFNYVSELNLSAGQLRRGIVAELRRLLAGCSAENCVVWAHNLGVGRNLILTQELTRATARRGIPLIAHHHDWWFDNRWQRWAEMRRFGIRTLAAAARATFSNADNVRHAAINCSDASLLQRHLPGRAAWLPNLAERQALPSTDRVRAARQWLQHKLGGPESPVWILPCRLLRRKNVAEALLLARWLRPEAWLVTSGGLSSADERPYYEKLSAAAGRHQWRMRLGVLAGNESRKPGVPELLAASECVMLTSAQEGFGLPFLEAAAAGRPLIARSLPNIAPDLHTFGFRFPQNYHEVLVATSLLDWPRERSRQLAHFRRWRRLLPATLRQQAKPPGWLESRKLSDAVPFSRLTVTAQLEVLAVPVEQSWLACVPLNPFLATWRPRAAQGRLQITPWPRSADRWLSGPAYAARFAKLLRAQTPPGQRELAAEALLEEFLTRTLAAANQYPLLWDRDT